LIETPSRRCALLDQPATFDYANKAVNQAGEHAREAVRREQKAA
jgi:hypothetical protein